MPNRPSTVITGPSRRHSKTCETHLFDQFGGATTTISIIDPVALVTMAREAPVAVAREAQVAMRTLDSGFNEHRISVIGAAYASAYHMMRTDRAWERFIKDPGWDDLSNRPKNTLRARNNMLLHVLRYVFRAEGEAARRRVRVYAGMLQDHFNKGFKPEGVISLIRTHGIEALREEGVALRRSGVRDRYLDDLDADDDENTTSAPKCHKRRRPALTPAQVDKCKAALATFNAEMKRYLEEHTQQATSPQRRGGTETPYEQSDDQPAVSAWRRR